MKEKWKKILRAVVFCLVLSISILGLNEFFEPVWFAGNLFYTAKGFYDEPEDTIETIFLGSSVVIRGIMPTKLYEDYGICSYNWGIQNGTMHNSYYWMEEVYRLHSESLTTVVFDVSALRSDAPEGTYRKTMDSMRMSDVKLRAIKDYVGDDKEKFASYVFPLIYYHDRWDSLGENDSKRFVEDHINGTRGYNYSEKKVGLNNLENVKVLNTVLDETAEPTEFLPERVAYLERMIAFCEEKGLKLVLLKTPTSKWSSSLHNAVQQIADENNLDFIDYNFGELYDELDFIYAFDSTDGTHLNYFGATKLTSAVGKYLVNNCDVTDVRGNEKYAFMDEQLEEYRARVLQQGELETAETITDYLDIALKGNNAITIAVKNTAAGALTDRDREYFRNIGLVKLAELNYRDSYIAVIENGEVIYEELKPGIKNDEPTSLSYSGLFKNGVKCTVTSGGYYDGKEATCTVGDKPYSKSANGINIMVYSYVTEVPVDCAVFNTEKTTSREVYASETMFEIIDGNDTITYSKNGIYAQVVEYLNKVEAAKVSE